MASGGGEKKTFEVKNLIADLPGHLIPQNTKAAHTASQHESTRPPARRLIIVGDVHGMERSLQALLSKVEFDKSEGDHLILVGDLVNKGPDSPGVIDTAIRLGASAVRGNHDNAVLLAAAELKAQVRYSATAGATSQTSEASSSERSHGRLHGDLPPGDICSKASDNSAATSTDGNTSTSRVTATTLAPAQLDWLASLPLMLRIEFSQQKSPLSRLVVVHAGLVPSLSLEEQDPHSIMHMRSLFHAADGGHIPMEESGDEGWAATWDRFQEASKAPTTVVFGHDAKRGLQLGKYSIGLDSACVYGRQLSALVIVATEHGVESQIVQVGCADLVVTEGAEQAV